MAVAKVVRLIGLVVAVVTGHADDNLVEAILALEQRQIGVNVCESSQFLLVILDEFPVVRCYGNQHEDAGDGATQYGQGQGNEERRLGHPARPTVGRSVLATPSYRRSQLTRPHHRSLRRSGAHAGGRRRAGVDAVAAANAH